MTKTILMAGMIGSMLVGQSLRAGTEVSQLDPKVIAVPATAAPKKIPCWFETNQDEIDNQSWMVHSQNTEIVQGQPGFHSPYAGTNSIFPNDGVRQTISLDLFLGAHLWPGGELYFNPEYYQGFGLAETRGFADFSNADAYKVGQSIGDVWIPHLFYRQTFGLGGEQEQLSTGPTQLAQKVDVDRVTINMGRLQVQDQFDNNSYANNGRTQFMNWSLVNAGAFDYSSDALGSTEGITIDYNTKNFAVRVGGFMVDNVSNGVAYDGHITRAWQDDFEYDQRISIAGHPGVIRFISWLSSVNVGSFAYTLGDPTNVGLDPTLNQKYRYEYGFVLNTEQEITKDIGVFMRISYRNGQTPNWDVTDIDQNLSLGTQLQGELWGRPDDVIGYGTFLSGLSNNEKQFYEAGGTGLLVGDGALNYQPEGGLEAYYNWQVMKHVTISADYQLIVDPGYNVDRGPINIFSARLHLEY